MMVVNAEWIFSLFKQLMVAIKFLFEISVTVNEKFHSNKRTLRLSVTKTSWTNPITYVQYFRYSSNDNPVNPPLIKKTNEPFLFNKSCCISSTLFHWPTKHQTQGPNWSKLIILLYRRLRLIWLFLWSCNLKSRYLEGFAASGYWSAFCSNEYIATTYLKVRAIIPHESANAFCLSRPCE